MALLNNALIHPQRLFQWIKLVDLFDLMHNSGFAECLDIMGWETCLWSLWVCSGLAGEIDRLSIRAGMY